MLGVVGAIGSASTGTAISSLSGIAATNATLAWFGGGSLASGGLGMAGGSVILGGIFIAPAVLVGGFLLASKSEHAMTEAEEYNQKVNVECEKINSVISILESFKTRIYEFKYVITEINKRLLNFILHLEETDRNHGNKSSYSSSDFSEKELFLIHETRQMAVALKTLLETPIIDSDGLLNKNSDEVIRSTKLLINSKNLI